MMRWLGLTIGLAALWIAIWIYIPAPTYFLLTFSVGGPEISAWLIVAGLIGVAVSLADAPTSNVARIGLGTSGVALLLSLGVWVRVPRTVR